MYIEILYSDINGVADRYVCSKMALGEVIIGILNKGGFIFSVKVV